MTFYLASPSSSSPSKRAGKTPSKLKTASPKQHLSSDEQMQYIFLPLTQVNVNRIKILQVSNTKDAVATA